MRLTFTILLVLLIPLSASAQDKKKKNEEMGGPPREFDINATLEKDGGIDFFL